MDVNNKNKNHSEIQLPESLLKKLSYNQKLIIEVLAKNPAGILSRDLTRETCISNKSDALRLTVRELLAKYELKIQTERISEKKQWLWTLQPISFEG